MVHVYPVAEEDLHELEGTMCPCGVKLITDEPELIVVHQEFATLVIPSSRVERCD